MLARCLRGYKEVTGTIEANKPYFMTPWIDGIFIGNPNSGYELTPVTDQAPTYEVDGIKVIGSYTKARYASDASTIIFQDRK